MFRNLLLIPVFISLFTARGLFGQGESQDLNGIDLLFTKNKFSAVWTHYRDLLQTDSLNPELNYKMAVCYLNSRSQKEKSLAYFHRAVLSKNKNVVDKAETYKLLGDACYLTSNFDEALLNYENYKKLLVSDRNTDKFELEATNKQIEMCRMAKELKELKELMFALINKKFSTPSKNSASSYCQYVTKLSSDQSSLTFTFKKPGAGDQPLGNEEFSDDIGSVLHVIPPESADTSCEEREATIATSADGQIILTYRDDKGDGNLYASSLNGNEWTAPEKISKMVNTAGWEPNEFISADGNTLYFACVREGGLGGKDIYKSTKLPDGKWSKAVNLGYPINTPFDEEAPFVHPDGVTLFFSSNRSSNKKRFDIFTSTLSDSGSWTKPVDVGYPLNKLHILEKSSRNVGSSGKDKTSYLVTFMNPKKIPLTLLKGKIACEDGKIPMYVEITVIDNETEEITGIYAAESKTGHYMFILPKGKNCNVTYQTDGYMMHTENMNILKEPDIYRLYNTIKLKPIAENSKEVLNNVFFKEDTRSLDPASYAELNRLIGFLNQNPTIGIELSGPAQPRETDLTEAGILKDKVEAVGNYLIQKGIDKERIRYSLSQKMKKNKKDKKESENDSENKFAKIELKIIKTK